MVFHRRFLRRARGGVAAARAALRRRGRRVRSFFRRPKVKKFLLPATIGLLTVLPIPGSRVAAGGLLARAGGVAAARALLRRFAPRIGRAVGRAARGASRGALKVTGLAPFQPIRAGLATIAAGAVFASPKLRKAIARTPETLFGVGTGLGERIEQDTSEKTGLAGTPAGLVGAAVAGALGLVAGGAVGAAVAGKIRERGERLAEPFGVSPLSPLTPTTQPLGAVQPEVKEPEPKAMEPLTMPSIKITNKPQNNINIKFSKSRRFINQQVLIRK